MAALTASQATQSLVEESSGPADPKDPTAHEAPDTGYAPGQDRGADEDAAGDGTFPYHTDLPPLDAVGPGEGNGGRPSGPGARTAEQTAAGSAAAGIPATVLDAYQHAEEVLGDTLPACRLDWEILAAIGKVESGHARGGDVRADGTTREPILGPVLNGTGFARILDTDGGLWDGDDFYDRAVGPMQFIPSTWARWGADGDGDGDRDPNNVYDATLAAGNYLCAGGRNLSGAADLDRALLSYNHSWDYVRTVRSWLEFYYEGTHKVPDGEGELPTSPGPGRAEGGDDDRRPRRPSGDGAEKEKKPAGGKQDKPEKPVETEEPDPEETATPSPPPAPTPSPTPTPPPAPTPTPAPEPTDPEPSPTEPPQECPTDPGPGEPEPTPTSPPTSTPSPTPTSTPTPSPTSTPSPTPIPTSPPASTPSPTPTSTPTPSPTPTAAPSVTPTDGGEEPGEDCEEHQDPATGEPEQEPGATADEGDPDGGAPATSPGVAVAVTRPTG